MKNEVDVTGVTQLSRYTIHLKKSIVPGTVQIQSPRQIKPKLSESQSQSLLVINAISPLQMTAKTPTRTT